MPPSGKPILIPRHDDVSPEERIEVVWRGIVSAQAKSLAIEMTHVSSAGILYQITGYQLPEALETADFLCSLAADADSQTAVRDHFYRLQLEHVSILSEYRILTKKGQPTSLEMHTQRLRQLGKGRYEVLGTLSQKAGAAPTASVEKEGVQAGAEETIRHLAFHDTLTDLPNRILLSERLAEALDSIREHGRQTAVLFIDLDGFKTVNDTLGHQAGDELLVHVAQRLRRSVREGDLVARFGGDEFVIVLKHVTGNDPERIAEAVLASLEEGMQVVGREVHISASIGVAVGPRDGETPEELLRNADNALYRAKDSGRRTVQVYTSAMHLLSSARLLMEESLRKAITRNEFFLEYQPICDTATGRIVAAEALVRWRHPLRDVVLPHEFMPLAEEVGIIEEIGRWMLSAAVAQVQKWQKLGVAIPLISLNISAREFRQKNFVDDFLILFAATGVESRLFQLELTESVVMEKLESILPKLMKLSQAGFKLVLDDFGKGHSSLAKLKQLPFSGLKIDQLFVREIGTSPGDRALLQAIIDLGHTLHMEVCVEGVETVPQHEALKSAGCDTVQGYSVSYPLGEKELLKLIAQ